MQSHFIGIDLGTTVLKAAMFAKDGTCLAESAAALPVTSDAHGKREQASETFPATFVRVIRKLIGASGVPASSVAGVGLAAQGGSFVPCNADSGLPLGPMVLWNDMRGRDRQPDIAARKSKAFWHPMSYVDGPVVGVAKLAHHAERHPAWFKKETMCTGAGAWLFHMLTGTWRQEGGHAIQLGCYNWKTNALDTRGHAAAGLDIPLPPMRPGHDSAPLAASMAKKTGLTPGIPVIGPYMDHEAGFLAVHTTGKRPMQVSLGTAWVANAVLPEGTDRTLSCQIFMPSPAGAGRFCVFPIRAGNQTWDWALGAFLGGTSKKHIRRADAMLAENPFPAGGLVALPYIYGANPVDPAQFGGVSFVGAGFATTKEDMLRATVGGLCCEFRDAVARAYPGDTCDAMILCGGTSRCPAIQQLLAALFPDIALFLNPHSDLAGPLGAVQAFGVKGLSKLEKVARPKKDFTDRAQAMLTRFLAARERLA